jgi:hypothetical protein
MRKIVVGSILAVAAMAVAALAQAPPAPAHVMTAPSELKWGPPPSVLEKEASFTVVSGDPGQPGPLVLRVGVPLEVQRARQLPGGRHRVLWSPPTRRGSPSTTGGSR